jgi:hypothetical protein
MASGYREARVLLLIDAARRPLGLRLRAAGAQGTTRREPRTLHKPPPRPAVYFPP